MPGVRKRQEQLNLKVPMKSLKVAFLLMVGFSLFFEGLEPVHHSHIDKGYIYVAMAFSFGVEILNLRMRRKAQQRRNPVALREPQIKKEEEEKK